MLKFYILFLMVYLYYSQKDAFAYKSKYVCSKIIFFYIIGFFISYNIFDSINVYYYQYVVYLLNNIVFIYTSIFALFFLFSFLINYILFPLSNNVNRD